MSKNTKKGSELAYDKATPELIEKVVVVLRERNAHKLSTSRIYEAHNAIFGLDETPESCASCLRRRADKIAVWYAGYLAEAGEPTQAATAGKGKKAADSATSDNGDTGKGAPLGAYQRPEGAVDYPLLDEEGVEAGTIVFTASAEDETKGTVTMADGTYVKPGTYKSGENEIKVAVGGKATVVNSLL